MRQETRLLKEQIKKIFPTATVHIKYVEPINYVFSSDKIVIDTDIPYDDLATFLKHNTSGIMIYEGGSVTAKGGSFDSTICGVETEVEFIEIRPLKKKRHRYFR